MAADPVLLVDDAEAEAGELAIQVGEDLGQRGARGVDLGAAGGVAAQLGGDDDADDADDQAGSPEVTE